MIGDHFLSYKKGKLKEGTVVRRKFASNYQKSPKAKIYCGLKYCEKKLKNEAIENYGTRPTPCDYGWFYVSSYHPLNVPKDIFERAYHNPKYDPNYM